MATQAVMGVTFNGSVNQNGKRTAEDGGLKPSGKRPMLRPAQTHIHNEVFKFLELPGELRNRVYVHIVGYTHNRFPILIKTPKKVVKRWTSPSSNDQFRAHPSTEPKPLPYIALTQTCMQIRSEFRPMWLPTHRIPFSLMDSYFKAFFPARTPKALARFKPHVNTIVGFRIWVRTIDLGTRWAGCDVTRLMRHKARFTGCTITCGGLILVHDRLLRALDSFLNHADPTWLTWIRTGRISQVRLDLDQDEVQLTVMVVVKEKFAEAWMKALASTPPVGAKERALKQFGFDNESGTVVQFSVDYS